MCSAAPLALRIGAEASLGLARQTLPLRFTNAHTCDRSRKVRCRRKSSAQKAHRIASHCALQRLRRIRADLCHCRGPRPFRSDKCMTIVQLASSPRRDGTLAQHTTPVTQATSHGPSSGDMQRHALRAGSCWVAWAYQPSDSDPGASESAASGPTCPARSHCRGHCGSPRIQRGGRRARPLLPVTVADLTPRKQV